jgi:hypothetical protein
MLQQLLLLLTPNPTPVRTASQPKQQQQLSRSAPNQQQLPQQQV